MKHELVIKRGGNHMILLNLRIKLTEEDIKRMFDTGHKFVVTVDRHVSSVIISKEVKP